MSVRTAEAGDLVSDGLLPSGAGGTAFSVARGFPAASPSWLATCREIPRVGHYKRLERTVRHGVLLEASPGKVPLL